MIIEIILSTIVATISNKGFQSLLKSEIHLYICKIETSQLSIDGRKQCRTIRVEFDPLTPCIIAHAR